MSPGLFDPEPFVRVARKEPVAAGPSPARGPLEGDRKVRSRLGLGWRELCLVALTLTSVTCLFYYEVTFTGRTFLPLAAAGVMESQGPYGFNRPLRQDLFHPDPGASAWQYEPWARLVAADLASGRLPLWNEHQGFGAPLLANAISGAMDILRLPVLVSGSALAWDLYYLLRVILGGLAAYAFGRVAGLVWTGALFLATAYAFSGHFVLFINNLWIEAYLLLPLILLGIEWTASGRFRLGFSVTAISVSLSILVGMPEVTLFVLIGAAFYAGYRVFLVIWDTRSIKSGVVPLVYVFAAFAIGVALSAPLLTTLAEYVFHSSRLAVFGTSAGHSTTPIRSFVFWFVPHLLRNPLEPATINSINNYVGTTILFLAILGVVPFPSPVYRRLVPFAAALGAILLAKAFGAPVIEAMGSLPGLNVTLIERWSAPVAGFCLILLASVAVHRLTVIGISVVEASIALVAIGWLLFVGLLSNWDVVAHESVEQMWVSIGAAGIAATAVWVLITLRRRFPSSWVGVGCIIVAAAELYYYSPHGVYQDRYDRFVEPPFVSFLRAHQALAGSRVFSMDGYLFPNDASAFGLDDIRSLDALYPERYLVYIQNFVSPQVFDRFVGGPFASAEGAALFENNPWFDLSGARYLITKPNVAELSGAGGIVDAILAENRALVPSPAIHSDIFTIDGVTKRVLFEHPPASLRYSVVVPADRPSLRFAPALSPEVWDPSKGNGVIYEVAMEAGATVEILFRRTIDPKHDVAQRRWVNESIDLSRVAGQRVTLVFSTYPIDNTIFDWSGWGDLRFAPLFGDDQKQYVKAYNREVTIFENLHVLPRTFLVSQVLPVSDESAAIDAMKSSKINPAVTAVVEGMTAAHAETVRSNVGTALIRSYTATNVSIDVASKGDEFLVLTDSYYPGWEATIDGRPVEIYPADLAFRGVSVPAGQHQVRFNYFPASFKVGIAVALVGLSVLLVIGLQVDRKVIHSGIFRFRIGVSRRLPKH